VKIELSHDEAMVKWCIVRAARAFHGLEEPGACASAFECERCAMPAKSAGEPCEMCGWRSFKAFAPLNGPRREMEVRT
jgi:hypothetical protein